jgi:4a-hydroxytetrahydrobiopterin dehydratase
MNTLGSNEVAARLKGMDGWELSPNGIRKTFDMGSFLSVMNLVNRVADLAEEANHHPEILITYDRVTFTLRSHDTGAVTERDLDLAARIEAIAP